MGMGMDMGMGMGMGMDMDDMDMVYVWDIWARCRRPQQGRGTDVSERTSATLSAGIART